MKDDFDPYLDWFIDKKKRRNPQAKKLRERKYQQKIENVAKKYRRKHKHGKLFIEDELTGEEE